MYCRYIVLIDLIYVFELYTCHKIYIYSCPKKFIAFRKLDTEPKYCN